MFMMFHPMYLVFVAPALLLAIYAQMRVRSAFNKYSKVPNTRGATGAQIAQAMLLSNGIDSVNIETVPGQLSDHYNPLTRTLRLSPQVYEGRSVAAAGIAAHEAGHALQHYDGYFPLQIRSLLVPMASIGSNLAFFLFFIGIVFAGPLFVNIGIILFTAVVAFSLVTLPVEFNASRRAVAQLSNGGIINMDEETGIRKVLNAAALTYVAGALMAILQLLYMIMRGRD